MEVLYMIQVNENYSKLMLHKENYCKLKKKPCLSEENLNLSLSKSLVTVFVSIHRL